MNLEKRLADTPTPEVIEEAGRCLDLENILQNEETTEVKNETEKSLKNLMRKANYEYSDIKKIMKQYTTFKYRLIELTKENGDYEEIVQRFSHLLFKTHICLPDCHKVEKVIPRRGKVKECPHKGMTLKPKIPNVWKLLHLIFKEQDLYIGLSDFLHLYLRCLVKTHAEGVVESMGNYVEIHGEKKRGRMDISDVGKEALIHWNGPPTAKADKLGRRALDRIFGKGQWHFITLDNKMDSVVTKRLRAEEPGLPFFN